MLTRRVNSVLTTSAGRLFDAIASLVNLRQRVAFEGQAAMELEFALEGTETTEAYPLNLSSSSIHQSTPLTRHSPPPTPPLPLILDWSPMIEALLADLQRGIGVGIISARFHNALVEATFSVTKHFGQERVVLSGGCFQNRYLTERTVRRLQAGGFRPYWHQRVPPNDGGIALGQVVAAWRQKG
jgi:hydrogenase maturation protein HypF